MKLEHKAQSYRVPKTWQVNLDSHSSMPPAPPVQALQHLKSIMIFLGQWCNHLYVCKTCFSWTYMPNTSICTQKPDGSRTKCLGRLIYPAFLLKGLSFTPRSDPRLDRIQGGCLSSWQGRGRHYSSDPLVPSNFALVVGCSRGSVSAPGGLWELWGLGPPRSPTEWGSACLTGCQGICV